MKAILLALFLVYASSFVLEKSDILAHGFKLVPFKRENIVSEQVQDVNDLPWPFTVCGAAADWEARSLALSNNPTVKLQFNFNLTGAATGDVNFYYVDIEVGLQGQPIGMIRDVWIISFASGDYIEYARGLQASQALPRGQYYVKLNFVNISSNPDGCVQFVFKI